MRSRATSDGERIAAVRDTALTTQASERHERLTRLAVEMLGVPVSLVSLVGEDRQFFPGQSGLPEPWAGGRETPLSHSFCRHVVEQREPLLIQDAREHPLVRENLAVRDLGVVSYAGVPLEDSDGQVLGAFCAIDTRPRVWTDREVRILEDLSLLARDAIDLTRLEGDSTIADPLTGLPAMAVFVALAELAAGRAARAGAQIAMVAIDLDGFRLVNEALGHAAGDEALLIAARRLVDVTRSSEAVCRPAGDEFFILCDGVTDEADALRVADRVRDAIGAHPMRLGAATQTITATAGVALGGMGESIEALFHASTTALRAAKSANRGTATATRDTGPTPAEALELRNSIAGAHLRDEMRVVFQPIVDLRTGAVRSLEALVRWTHPELGPIAPDRFIPKAERTGAIIGIGEWVLDEACRSVAAWRRRHPHLRVAVNLAPTQLAGGGLVECVARALREHGLPPDALTLELTERLLLDDRPAVTGTLRELRAMGIALSLDDFGTGYSALGYLARFELDALKIDRTFISRIDEPRSRALVDGILAMARGLGLTVVAEGIETDEQRAAVTALGAGQGQGYLFARPLEHADVASALDGWPAAGA